MKILQCKRKKHPLWFTSFPKHGEMLAFKHTLKKSQVDLDENDVTSLCLTVCRSQENKNMMLPIDCMYLGIPVEPRNNHSPKQTVQNDRSIPVKRTVTT